MKDIYDIFIKSVKNRDYESVAWILNYVDPKALHDLICEANPTANIDDDSIVIWHTKIEFISIYWQIANGYITIGVKYSKDNNDSVISLIRPIYSKFQLITLSIEPKGLTDTFTIARCCPLGNCVYGKSLDEIHDEITKPVTDKTFDEVSDDDNEMGSWKKYWWSQRSRME